MKLKKYIKGLSKKQKIIWLGVIAFLIIILLRRSTGSNANARKAAFGYQVRTFDPAKVYKMIMLTDVTNWEVRCRAIAAAGFDTVQLVVPMSNTFVGGLNYYVDLANYAVSQGLNIVLKPWIRVSPEMLGTFPLNDLMKGPGGEMILDLNYILSFGSTRWSFVYNWFGQVKEAFQSLQDAGYIVANFPAISETQEWGYPLPFQGDWSNAETTASNGLNQTRDFSYSVYQANQLKEKLHAIAAIFNGWNNGLDVGSFFYDFHKWGGTYHLELIADHPQIRFIKNNPMNDDSFQFNAALCYDWKRRTGKYFAAEYTNSPSNTAKETLAERHGAMIQNGCNLLSFAFHSPDGTGAGESFQKAKDTKALLEANGLWNSPVMTPNRQGDFTYTVLNLFQNGHSGIIGSFNSNPARNVRITA